MLGHAFLNRLFQLFDKRGRERRILSQQHALRRPDCILEHGQQLHEILERAFLLIWAGWRVVHDNIVVNVSYRFFGERHILGLLITNNAHHAAIGQIVLNKPQHPPALKLAIAAQTIEERGQNAHAGLLALGFENAGLIDLTHSQQFHIDAGCLGD